MTTQQSSTRPNIAVLETGERHWLPDWVARAFASPQVEVYVCPWWSLWFVDGQVWARGALRQLLSASRPLRALRVDSLKVDVLYFDGETGGTAPSRPEEGFALERLARVAQLDPRMSRREVVNRLMLAASSLGVPSNAISRADERWDPKDSCELLLRRFDGGGHEVARPKTRIFPASQLQRMASEVHEVSVILKPAAGAQGRGLEFLPAGTEVPVIDRRGAYVVQNLVTPPVLADAHKLDVRCHVLIDMCCPDCSGIVEPLLIRSAASAYSPTAELAENCNISFQRSRNARPTIRPVNLATGLDDDSRAQVVERVRNVARKFVSAVGTVSAAWAREPRVMVWGVDMALSRNELIEAWFLECNVRPALRFGATATDLAMARLLRAHARALLGHARSTTTSPSQGIETPPRDMSVDSDRGYAWHCWDYDCPGGSPSVSTATGPSTVCDPGIKRGPNANSRFVRACSVPEQFKPAWQPNNPSDHGQTSPLYDLMTSLRTPNVGNDEPSECTITNSTELDAQEAQAKMRTTGDPL